MRWEEVQGWEGVHEVGRGPGVTHVDGRGGVIMRGGGPNDYLRNVPAQVKYVLADTAE